MERLLSKRDLLGKEIEKLKKDKSKAMSNHLDTSEIENEIDTVRSNIEYVQDSIAEAQHHIMHIEEAKAVPLTHLNIICGMNLLIFVIITGIVGSGRYSSHGQ